MITSDSRYTQAAHETPLSHTYTDRGHVEIDPDTNAVIENSRDTTYLLTTGQPAVPPQQYMVRVTDNIQLLAYRHLQDPAQWWVIANANPHVRYPFDLKMGDTIYIPA